MGGVAGQFEPNVSVVFGEDAIQQMKQQIDEMMGIVGELKGKIGPAADKLMESLTKIDDEIDKLNEGIIDPLIKDYPCLLYTSHFRRIRTNNWYFSRDCYLFSIN